MTPHKYNIFDNMIEGVQIISKEWRYFYVNESVIKHSKFLKKDLLGYTMEEKYPGIEKTEMFKTIQKCMSEGSSQHLISEFIFPDGSLSYFELRMQTITEGVLILSYDITDQKLAEELIKRTNIQLEELVQQRTKELTDQKIIIENQLRHLEVLNNTKDKFFSIVAHDLKSPLNGLRSFSNLLVNHIEKLDKREIIDVSRQLEISVNNSIKMADNLISWAKVQMNDYETHQEKIYLEELVANIFEVFSNISKNKGIKLTYFVENNLAAWGDTNQIAFVIRNLINNAIKFTQTGGSIELKARTHSNLEVLISVSDTGIGMAEDLKKKLFLVGKKQNVDGTDGEKGTGLGLILSYEFLKLNQGHIDVESQRGKGTTFTITLKAATIQPNSGSKDRHNAFNTDESLIQKTNE